MPTGHVGDEGPGAIAPAEAPTGDRPSAPDGPAPHRPSRDAARQPLAEVSLPRVPAFDGLRGLAVAAVLLFHGGYLRGGWLGVDLFFVLSGYLITSLLLAERRRDGRIDLAAFWGRRARRLLPALVLVLVAVSIYGRVALDPADLGVLRADGLATVFFVANWHDILSGASYWNLTLAPSLLAHMWSLAVEEQLYVLWPLALTVVLGRRRRGPARLVARVALAVAAASASVAIALELAGASHERIYLGTDTRAVAVALGAFVAASRRARRRPPAPGSAGPDGDEPSVAPAVELGGVVALVLLAVAWWGLDGDRALTYRGGLLAASVAGAVVVGVLAEGPSRLRAVLAFGPLRYLGDISYGLYLWHWPLFLILSERRTGLDGVALLAVRLAVSIAVASASWFLVERPIRERRPAGAWVGRRGAASAVGAMALAVVAILAGTLGATTLPADDLGTGVARSTAGTGLPKVVVLGDSVAASLAGPAIADPKAYGLDVARSTVLGCQAIWDGTGRARGIEGEVTTPPACPPDVRSFVAAERPAAVLVLYGGWTDAEYEIDGAWRGACDGPYEAALRRRFEMVVADAASSGATVVVANAARSTNTYRRADNWEHTACTNRVVEAVAKATTGVRFVDLDAWLCPDGRCRERADGLYIRSDGVHFQGPGGETATSWVLGEVARLAGLDATGTAPTRTDAEDALASVCRSFADVNAIGGSEGPAVLGTAEGREQVRRGLDGFTAEVIDRLPPAVAADVRPLADPGFQRWAADLLDAFDQGKAPGSLVPPIGSDVLDRAFNRLRQTC